MGSDLSNWTRILRAKARRRPRQAVQRSDPGFSFRADIVATAGLAEVRDGRPAEAELLLNELLGRKAGFTGSKGTPALMFAVRALARAQLKRLGEAQADLAEVERRLPNVFPAPPAPSDIIFDSSTMAAVLAREEARALLKQLSVP
jgi:hypothetical protein